MEELLYNWFGLNEWLFGALYMLNFPALGGSWKILSYGYSPWVVACITIAVCYRYLRIRHTATERQLETMGEFMVGLITAFSVVWSTVYTFQNITLMPRPWVVLPDVVALQTPLFWHEGLPASAPAIAIMIVSLAWKHVSKPARRWLMLYAAAGCLFCVVSGVNWPVEVVAGAVLGWAGARIGQWYLRFARRIVAP